MCYIPVSYTHLDVYKRQIVTDCEELGIETATPDELARLKQTWGGD